MQPLEVGAVALGVFFVVVGATHFVLPGYYIRLVPSWLPGAHAIVLASGAAELVAGTLVLVPATRTLGAWLAAALITVYLTSHVDALARCRGVERGDLLRGPPAAVLRLVVNLGYLAWAVAVALSD